MVDIALVLPNHEATWDYWDYFVHRIPPFLPFPNSTFTKNQPNFNVRNCIATFTDTSASYLSTTSTNSLKRHLTIILSSYPSSAAPTNHVKKTSQTYTHRERHGKLLAILLSTMDLDGVSDLYFAQDARLASFQVSQPAAKRKSNAKGKAGKTLAWPHRHLDPDSVS